MKFHKNENLFTKPKFSLKYKFTINFVLFGLIVGVVSFYFTVAQSTRQQLEEASTQLASKLELYYSEYDPEDAREKLREDLDAILDSELVELPALHHFNLYFKRYTETHWQIHTIYAADKADLAGNPVSDQFLNRVLTSGMKITGFQFFKKIDSVTAYISASETELDAVFAITIKKKGILHYLSEKRYDMVIFGLSLLIFSYILGIIFSRRITKPIYTLAQKALDFHEGNNRISVELSRKDEIGVLSRILDETYRESSSRLHALELMNSIDKAVLGAVTIDELIQRVTEIISEFIPGSRVAIAVYDDEDTTYRIKSAAGHSEVSRSGLRSPDTENIFGTEDPYRIPLYMQGKYYGSLLVTGKEETGLSDEEKLTLKKLGDQAAVALQRVIEIEERNQMQMGSIMALSRAIDAKSKWTAGHSERVAKLSEQLAKKLNFDESMLERLIISALLHDIGKIGVPEEILDKPSKLDADEFRQIKKHSEIGYSITGSIPHFSDICEGVKYHHERWNGSGYPDGLKNINIPVFARIIALADVFDALTSERPYRSNMTMEEALVFIQERRGKDFDPMLSDKFIQMIKNTFAISAAQQ